jgi:endonuclease YncB( thermonuclease family)
MTLAAIRSSMLMLLATALPHSGHAADVISNSQRTVNRDSEPRDTAMPVAIAGRASVIDGRTLWFPRRRLMVRLASIDACELPQWSYDPRRHGDGIIPKPVPCGPLAKAWLKRSVSNAPVKCNVVTQQGGDALLGRCTVRGRDLAQEMLRVGWARTISPARADYLTWQTYAMAARHGMWATYVLDMDEWRAKTTDRTAARRPIADFKLLEARESEISPPFEDARKRWQTDR